MRLFRTLSAKLREYDYFVLIVATMSCVILAISRLFGAIAGLIYLVIVLLALCFNAGAHTKGDGELPNDKAQ